MSSYQNEVYKGFKGKLKFASNFFNLVDILAITPFILSFFNVSLVVYFKVLRMFRILRIMRYMTSLKLMVNAFKNKKEELLITIQMIILLAILLSVGLYYVESDKGSGFDSILQALLWSISKYIQDIAGYGDFTPVTGWGKFLATLNGILGIAIFALPAGIIASAFLDEIIEAKKKKEIENSARIINRYFNAGYAPRAKLGGRMAHYRWSTFEVFQSRLYLKDEEIFDVIREIKYFRFRAVKSSSSLTMPDVKTIERFVRNTSYGAYIKNSKCNIYFFVPRSYLARYIGHFGYTLASNLGYNYISVEVPLYSLKDEEIDAGSTRFYKEPIKDNLSILPDEFYDLLKDFEKFNRDDIVVFLRVGKSSRSSYEIVYQMSYEDGTYFNLVDNTEMVFNLFDKINKYIEVENINFQEPLTIKFEALEYKPEWAEVFLRNNFKCNVITLLLNLKRLSDSGDRYYSFMNVLLNAFKDTFGEYDKSEFMKAEKIWRNI